MHTHNKKHKYINKYPYSVESYLTIERREVLADTQSSMNLEKMLNETGYSQRAHCVVLLIGSIQNKPVCGNKIGLWFSEASIKKWRLSSHENVRMFWE